MTEIEKMFKNAGVKKQYCGWLDMGDLDCQPKYFRCNSITEWEDAVFSSRFGESEEEPEHKYPPFTAEKQIAILKLLTQQCDLTISHFTKWEFIHFDGQEPLQITGKDFAETLAKLVNAYWKFLADQEKTSIKNIIEG